MPDWSYHPLLKPVLFQLPATQARDFTLAATGLLGDLPGGKLIFDVFGHMSPDPALTCQAIGQTFASPIGLGAGLDVNGVAANGFAHFGFGFLELGPITLAPIDSDAPISRRIDEQSIVYPDLPVNAGVEALIARLKKYKNPNVPLAIRLGIRPGANPLDAAREHAELMRRLASVAAFFVLNTMPWSVEAWHDHLRLLISDTPAKPILLHISPDRSDVEALAEMALTCGVTGVVIGEDMAFGTESRLVGRPAREPSLHAIRCLKDRFGDRLTIIGAGGIGSPAEAQEFLDAGATLIQIHSGLVYSGPGLPKRINEALAYAHHPKSPAALTNRTATWVWALLLGLGLAIAGIVVWYVAATRTVLPYDESFVGASRTDLIAINANLLPFMTHDRVTLAGTMIATGVLYIGMAAIGMRRGWGWARHAFVASALVGFLSFFLFLGFGYFDPIHALLTIGLFPLFIGSLRGTLPPLAPMVAPNRTNNRRWQLGWWAQLFFVTIGVGLLLAGLAISTVGITQVFVPEDLHFMHTTAAALNSANSHLLPLIAHDRVGFGGNLISVGFAVLLLSLWGFRQGERWVWWTLAAAGIPGFVAGVGVHFVVGYIDWWHLFPAIVALVLFIAGLILSFPFLYYPDTAAHAENTNTPGQPDKAPPLL
jgi:dihydroorotate dehydrogenase